MSWQVCILRSFLRFPAMKKAGFPRETGLWPVEFGRKTKKCHLPTGQMTLCYEDTVFSSRQTPKLWVYYSKERRCGQGITVSLFGENLAQFHKATVQNIDFSHVLWPVHLPGGEAGRFAAGTPVLYFLPGLMIQYSRTPARWYKSSFTRRSWRWVEGERTSTTMSGAPLQPWLSSLSWSHTTEISGSTIVSTSSGASPAFSNRRTAKGAAYASHFFPSRKLASCRNNSPLIFWCTLDGGGHHDDLPVNHLCPVTFVPGEAIRKGVTSFFCWKCHRNDLPFPQSSIV